MENDSSRRTPLNRNQKKALWALVVFSVFVLVFSVWQIRNKVYSPFDYSKQIAAANKTGNNQNNQEKDSPLDVNKDSDSDGLSDSDETNIYHTSPYLEDSDSDGFSDREEVINGTDPNCPAGQNCQTAATALATSTVSNTTGASASIETNATGTSAIEDLVAGQSDAATLRQLLLDSGMDKATLDKISDADLMKSYQDSLNSADSSSQ